MTQSNINVWFVSYSFIPGPKFTTLHVSDKFNFFNWSEKKWKASWHYLFNMIFGCTF